MAWSAETVHVAICGAGVIGAATAYYLARRGADVTLVERARPAAAASGKSAGFLALDWCDGSPQGPLARASFAEHAQLAETLDADYGYRRLETLQVAASARRALPVRAGGDEPWLADSCIVGGALGDATTTAQLHPRRFTEALVAAACQHGGHLRIGEVTGLLASTDGGRAVGVQVDGERLHADAVVVAMGPWTALLGELLDLPPIGGLKGYSVTLRAREPLPARSLFADYETADGERLSPELVTRPDGETYICGLSGDAPLPLDPDDISVDEVKCAELTAIAAHLAPALEGAEVTARQACYRPICADAMPLLGPAPAMDGAYVATAHNCWGMLNAPASGLAMSELVLDGAARVIDLEPLSPKRRSARC